MNFLGISEDADLEAVTCCMDFLRFVHPYADVHHLKAKRDIPCCLLPLSLALYFIVHPGSDAMSLRVVQRTSPF